ncbi:MAG: hypothetical protein HKO13_07540 [Sphingomonas sp.]|nr:hypothetical protein [Sphingomonas sp.]
MKISPDCDVDWNRTAWLAGEPRDYFGAMGFGYRPLVFIGATGSGTVTSEYGRHPYEFYEIEFEGRLEHGPDRYGHLGSRGSQAVVDQMISMRPIAGIHCQIDYSKIDWPRKPNLIE